MLYKGFIRYSSSRLYNILYCISIRHNRFQLQFKETKKQKKYTFLLCYIILCFILCSIRFLYYYCPFNPGFYVDF